MNIIADPGSCHMVEKHITLEHTDINCPDNNFGLLPDDLYRLVKLIK